MRARQSYRCPAKLTATRFHHSPPLPPTSLAAGSCSHGRPDWALVGAFATVFGVQRLVPTYEAGWYKVSRLSGNLRLHCHRPSVLGMEAGDAQL